MNKSLYDFIYVTFGKTKPIVTQGPKRDQTLPWVMGQ